VPPNVITLKRVHLVVASVLRVPVEHVEPHVPLYQVTELDSMHLAEIAAALDEEFNIRLPTEGLEAVQTVEDLARLVGAAPQR
jgi:acyl carrier protein